MALQLLSLKPFTGSYLDGMVQTTDTVDLSTQIPKRYYQIYRYVLPLYFARTPLS